MDEVVNRIAALGIEIDVDTIEYHMYATRKMPRPAKKVKRERYWTLEQIDQFVAAL
ncbi:DNA-binding protein [Mycolicibacterium sp. BiH015]|uniref:DNA-binding protein n=1 Tax=Mycolicibacterium sp. BiH015 TaxID=3018808 RepID=UPI0022E1DBB7|nr:DNA-binding protein [Mycolicibacterium sp. BiH015]MDA2890995.1 DNA-binding protein [Mycolicibacterium sp. BiH015]